MKITIGFKKLGIPKDIKYKKMVLLIATASIILAVLAIVVWDIASWQQRGWTGMIVGDDKEVRKIYYGGPADQAGLIAGHEILDINGIPADSTKQIDELAARSGAGDSVSFRIQSDEHTILYIGPASFHGSTSDTSKKEIIYTTTLPSPFRSLHIFLLVFTSILIALIFAAIGFWVYNKRPDDRRAMVFYLLSAAAAVYFLLQPAGQMTSVNVFGFERSGFSVPVAIMVWWFLFAPLLLHLALIFPRESPAFERNPHILKWVYSIPVFLPALILFLPIISLIHQQEIIKTASAGGFFKYELHGAHFVLPFEVSSIRPSLALLLDLIFLVLAIYIFPRWRKTATYSERVRPLTTMSMLAFFGAALIGGSESICSMFKLSTNIPATIFIMWIFILFLFLGSAALYYPLATFTALVRSYRQSGVDEKRQVRWPLLATMIAVGSPFVIGFVSIGYFYLHDRAPNSFLMMLTDIIQNGSYILIPIAFAFAILKYRLMDIDLIIKKTIIYSAVTGLLVLLFFGLAGGLGGFLVQSTGLQNQWMIVFATLAVALVFVPLRNRVQEFIDRRFYRKKHDYPQFLKQLGSEVHEAADQKALLKCIAENLQQSLPNRATVVFLKSPGDHNFWAKAKIGLPDEVLGRLKIAPTSPLLAELDDISHPPKADLPELDRHIVHLTRADVLIPVKARNEMIGLISLGKKLSDLDYDEDDREYLLSVAEHLAIGLEHVRLREQEKEFEQAREIQQRLLPSEIPQIQGFEIVAAWQPARAVSGDYYDALKFSNSKLGLCIADVVGKGMPAALLMSNMQAAVKAFATEATQPKELCTQVNRFLRNNIARDQFITFFYCLLDAEKKSITYSRAGHNESILVRHDGSHGTLETGGPALGILAHYDFEQEKRTLTSGDRILLYTDGVTEAMNAENEEFGEARLLELLMGNRNLSSIELQQCVMAAVADFTHGAFQDDVTMLVIGVE